MLRKGLKLWVIKKKLVLYQIQEVLGFVNDPILLMIVGTVKYVKS